MNERLSIDTFDKPHVPAGTVCGSCGKNPPYRDFAMCAPCRIAAGLPVDEKTVAAVEAARQAAQQRREQQLKEAHERFATKNQKPKEAAVRHKLEWTPEMDATLKTTAPKGLKACMDALNLSRSSVYRRSNQLDIKFGMNIPKAKVKVPCAYCGKEVCAGTGKVDHERACKDNPANMAAAIAEQESCPESLAEVAEDAQVFQAVSTQTGEVVAAAEVPAAACEKDSCDGQCHECDELSIDLPKVLEPYITADLPSSLPGSSKYPNIARARDLEAQVRILAERVVKAEQRVPRNLSERLFGRGPVIVYPVLVEGVVEETYKQVQREKRLGGIKNLIRDMYGLEVRSIEFEEADDAA